MTRAVPDHPFSALQMRRLSLPSPRRDYFAHFTVDTLTATAFSQLEALQGRRGTYYTSSLRSFETQEAVVRSARDIVDRYF